MGDEQSANVEGDDNSKFFQHIVQLTKKASESNFGRVLEQDCSTLFELITRDYKNNIKIAALNGRNMAYICLYIKDAKYRHTIPIHDFLFMPEKIIQGFQEANLEHLSPKLRKELAPFVLHIRSLRECTELHDCNFYKLFSVSEPSLTETVMVVSVSW
jgi:hypothetical protein